MAATPAPDPLFFWNRAAAPAPHHPAVFPASGSTFGVGAAPTASRTVADTVSGSHQCVRGAPNTRGGPHG